MSGARETILGTLKRTLAAAGRDEAAPERRIAEHQANLIPTRGAGDRAAQVARFTQEAEAVEATVRRIAHRDELPAEIARYLSSANLPAQVRVAPSLADVDWAKQPTLGVEAGVPSGSDTASVSSAMAGVAETGTLVFLSGPENPTSLNFVPPAHIAVLSVRDLDGDYETVWGRLRAAAPEMPHHFLPRNVNWITGPSRTGDIELTLLLGAHGPQRLHIVLIDDDGPEG